MKTASSPLAETSRRRLLVAAAVGMACSAGAWAQPGEFPGRPVTVIVAFSSGSGPDVLLRAITSKLSILWGQPVVIENRPGGAGFVAIEAARRATPDGYTILLLDSENLSALEHLYKKRNFRPLEHFDVATAFAKTSFVVTVPVNSPWSTMSDLISAAKAKPGAVNFGSWGIGSPGHLGAEWLGNLAGIKMTHVPYKDTAQLITSVSSGDLDWSFTSIASSTAQYKAGKLKYLAVAGSRRWSHLPDVPTMAESGGPAHLDVNSFAVLTTPKGVPQAVRTQIHADVLKVLADPEVRARLAVLAFEPMSLSVDETLKILKVKSDTYRQLVADANINLD